MRPYTAEYVRAIEHSLRFLSEAPGLLTAFAISFPLPKEIADDPTELGEVFSHFITHHWSPMRGTGVEFLGAKTELIHLKIPGGGFPLKFETDARIKA